MDIIERINHYNPPALARRAECAEPASHVSDGADFLAHVRDKVVELVEQYVKEEGGQHADAVTHYREPIQDTAAVAGMSADPVEKWRQFVDLRTYEEDTAEFGTPTNNTLEGHADLALFFIGFRLASKLLTEIEEGSK
jgi:hypothetical protein